MNIAVIGSGYVGLVTGVCLSHLGHRVICVDNNAQKIKTLKEGHVPIYEPGLDKLIKECVRKKKLSFTTSIAEATSKSLAIFIAVGTPPKETGEADLVYIENVARQIAACMKDYKLIIEKSTVPAQTGEKIERTIRKYLPEKLKKLKFDVASNPEFLREGSAIEDFMHPDRVVIGVSSAKAEELLREIYKPINPVMVVTDINSAELIKHASNSFLATKISFINAVARVCELVGADVLKVAEGMGLDKRIGRRFLDAGIGYGGSCFPKDVDAFIRLSEKSGYDFHLLRAVREINEERKLAFIKLIEDKMWIVREKTIGVLGLAFKPNTDDMRSAPAIDIIAALQKEGARIKAYDPQAMENAKKMFKDVVFAKDAYDLSKGCDALLLLTEWNEFRDLDFKRIKKLVKQPLLFDGRNLYHDGRLMRLGFEYYGVGIGKFDS